MSDAIEKIESGIKPLARVAAIAGVFAGVGVLYWFYMDNVYHPKIKVTDVDYEKGIANLEIKEVFTTINKTLYAGSLISAGGHWAVRFAGPSDDNYTRLELVKNDITYKTLSLSPTAYPVDKT